MEQSIRSIGIRKAAQAKGLEETEHYEHGHKLRPLHHLWKREVYSEVIAEVKPQPWSLPLRASEIHRVKRALWRLEIFAALSHDSLTPGRENFEIRSWGVLLSGCHRNMGYASRLR